MLNPNDCPFVKTKDAETAQALRDSGFKEINSSGGMYVFVNCPALTFSEGVEPDNLVYSTIYTAS